MIIPANSCFVLHQRPYKETSIILDAFSQDYGLVSLIAKGAKRKKSKFMGLLNLYCKLKLAWQGKSELLTLTFAEQVKNISFVSNKTLIAGFYLNELIIRLMHKNEPHLDLFNAYENALDSLKNENNEEKTLRIFEKHLLNSLGYGLVLDQDINTGKELVNDFVYFYKADQGPMSNKPDINDYIKISGQSLNDIKSESFISEKSLSEAKNLMRYLLQKQLGGRPLASRNLYKSYLATAQTS